MRDYPCKIPLSLTDDMEIYEHLSNSKLEFKQPVWSHYRKNKQIKELITGLLTFDDSKRLKASDALQLDLFSPASRLSNSVDGTALRSLEDLLFINAFKSQMAPLANLNSVSKGVLYFLAHRVISEQTFSYYRDVWRHVEVLCSTKLDGYVRHADIQRLPKNLRDTMHVIFANFARPISHDVAMIRDETGRQTVKPLKDEHLSAHRTTFNYLRNDLQYGSDNSSENVLSLLDFIVAVHELSTMVNLEQPLASAFTLLGGSDQDGVTVAQLHKGICSGQRSIPQKFLDEIGDLMGFNDQVSSNATRQGCD